MDSNAIAFAPGYDKGLRIMGNIAVIVIVETRVAVADINGELKRFVDWFVKAKKRPNITNLVLTEVEEDARKGGVPPRMKKKSIAATSRTPAPSLLTTTSTSTGAITTTAGECSTLPTTLYASGGLPVIPRQVCVPTYLTPLVHYSPSST